MYYGSKRMCLFTWKLQWLLCRCARPWWLLVFICDLKPQTEGERWNKRKKKKKFNDSSLSLIFSPEQQYNKICSAFWLQIKHWFCHRCRPAPPRLSLSKFPSLSLLLDWRLDPPFYHRCVSVRSAHNPSLSQRVQFNTDTTRGTLTTQNRFRLGGSS